jgi:hypothetical protein
MSRAQDSFSIPVSVDDAHAVCIEAAGKDGWRIQDSDLEHFYLRQNVTLFDPLQKRRVSHAIEKLRTAIESILETRPDQS